MRVKFTDGAEADFEDALSWFERIGSKSEPGHWRERG
jgi:hypothetical protein